jgi:hypothetical protein
MGPRVLIIVIGLAAAMPWVLGDITGASWGGTLRGRGGDTGYEGSLAFTAGQTSANVPFEFTRRGPDILEGTIENSWLRVKWE